MNVEVTVAICTRNRRDELVETLQSVSTQEWDGEWDVLVVDNASTDDTMEAARALAKEMPVPLHVESHSEPGLAGARNHALRVARGRAVVFIDDDVTCEPGWLAAHGEAFRQSDVAAVAGPIRPRVPPETPEWFLFLLKTAVGGPTSRYDFGDEPVEILPTGNLPPPFGANMGMLRERALAVDGFRTDLGWGKRMIPSEEFEFFRRYRTEEGRFVYVPEAALVHRIQASRTTSEYFSRWHRGYGRSLAVMDPPLGIKAYLLELRIQRAGARYWKLVAKRERRAHRKIEQMQAVAQRERHRGFALELLRQRPRRAPK